jgi:hypothetical protein
LTVTLIDFFISVGLSNPNVDCPQVSNYNSVSLLAGKLPNIDQMSRTKPIGKGSSSLLIGKRLGSLIKGKNNLVEKILRGEVKLPSGEPFFHGDDKLMIINQFLKMSPKGPSYSKEFLVELFEEYRKFAKILINCEVSGENTLFPSTLVEEMWQAHILCTKSYITFCTQFKNEYIHHTPLNGFNSLFEEYRSTLILYSLYWQCEAYETHPTIWEKPEGEQEDQVEEVVFVKHEKKDENRINHPTPGSNNNILQRPIIDDNDILTISSTDSSDKEEKGKEKVEENEAEDDDIDDDSLPSCSESSTSSSSSASSSPSSSSSSFSEKRKVSESTACPVSVLPLSQSYGGNQNTTFSSSSPPRKKAKVTITTTEKKQSSDGNQETSVRIRRRWTLNEDTA